LDKLPPNSDALLSAQEAKERLRVQAATRAFTDVGGCRGAEGKPNRSQSAGVSRDLVAALSDERHGDPRKLIEAIDRHEADFIGYPTEGYAKARQPAY
jgi:hypothetical protein